MRVSSTWYKALLVIIGLLHSNLASADSADIQYLTSIGKTKYHLHRSPSLEHDYHVYVLSPETSDADSIEKYPTVYLLDGGITYPLLAAYSQYLSLAEDIPKIIVVGISYGTDDFRTGNRRGTDFTAPASSREHYGGAEKFQAMLRDELFPLIERGYRSDPERRILFGQSLGGQFSIFNALTKPDLFSGLIASNPALHRNLDFFLQSHYKPNDEASKPRLYISRAENDDKQFFNPAQRWVDHWSKEEPKSFMLKVNLLENHNHFSAAPEAFRDGLMWILGTEN
jgi:predicted alpha/beta superfamily hydrolase